MALRPGIAQEVVWWAVGTQGLVGRAGTSLSMGNGDMSRPEAASEGGQVREEAAHCRLGPQTEAQPGEWGRGSLTAHARVSCLRPMPPGPHHSS